MSELVLCDIDDAICTLTLNNPEKYNAFNAELIDSLIKQLDSIENNNTIRVVILRSTGKHFCAGADLDSMKAMANFTEQENIDDAMQLATLLEKLNQLSKPTIALVQGRAMGGGAGLLCCCDIVLARHDASFCFSEVKLGLIPATISPYVLKRIGYGATRFYFVTAELIPASTALRIGLVHHIHESDHLYDIGKDVAEKLTKNSPHAIAAVKQLMDLLAEPSADLPEKTAKLLAQTRVSAEAQEGIQAFLEKRPPNWMKF